MRRIDELTEPPVVRCYYLVPTVNQEFFGYHRPWAVIGPKHNDREFLKFDEQHYHLDGRFIEPWLAKRLLKVCGNKTFEDLIAAWPLMGTLSTEWRNRVVVAGPVVYRRMRCYRNEAAYDYPMTARLADSGFPKLWNAYAGQPCDRDEHGGLICPHRRAPLGSLVAHDGVIRCPLHGLRINATTGFVLATAEGGLERV